MAGTLEINSLSEDQKRLVERLSSSPEHTLLTLHGEPWLSVMPVINDDEFEPLTEAEEAEIVAAAGQADEDRHAGRLTVYRDIRSNWLRGEANPE